MILLTERWVIPWLALMAEWSVRWGVVIALLAAWLALRPPRSAATRQLLCLAAVAAGLLLPIAPRWGDAVVPWPARAARVEAGSPASPVAAAVSQRASAVGPTLLSAAPRPREIDPFREAAARPEPAGPTGHLVPLRSDSRPLGAWRRAALMAALAWAAIVLALLVRLASRPSSWSSRLPGYPVVS